MCHFYFNADENLCADEWWVCGKLAIELGMDEREILEELHSRREFYGWYECQVSNTIAEHFE